MDVTEEIEDVKEEEMEEDDIEDEESSESSSGDEVSDDEDIVEKTDVEEAKPLLSAYLPGQEIAEGEELVMDDQAYTIYHQATLGIPCLSFDVIPDHLGNDRADSYPMTIYGKKQLKIHILKDLLISTKTYISIYFTAFANHFKEI